MMDLFNDSMDEKAIHNPDYYEDAECLKQVNIYPNSNYYQFVDHKFKYSRAKWLYCKLVIWRDEEWMLYFARSHNWPFDQAPYPEQLKQGYRASKNRDCHMFDLTDGNPWDEQKRVA